MPPSTDTDQVEVGFGFDTDVNVDEIETFEKDPFENNETTTDPEENEFYPTDDPDFDPEAMKSLITEKQKNQLSSVFGKDNRNDDEMDVTLATKVVTHCSTKDETKKLYCYNQIILEYTRGLITKIIKIFESKYPDLYNQYVEELSRYGIPINDNLYISETKNNKKSEYAFQMYDEAIIGRLWTLLIRMIYKIKIKENKLGNKYYRKIFYFFTYELAYLRYLMPYNPNDQNDITFVKIKLCRNALGTLDESNANNYAKSVDLSHFFLINENGEKIYLNEGKIKEYQQDKNNFAANYMTRNYYDSIRNNKDLIIQFLSSDCSAIVLSSDPNYNTKSAESDVLYGGKRHTRRKHKKSKHFRRGTSSKCHKTAFSKKCHKTMKRKSKKTMKRKHIRRRTRRL
jgi:hypothetical protein